MSVANVIAYSGLSVNSFAGNTVYLDPKLPIDCGNQSFGVNLTYGNIAVLFKFSIYVSCNPYFANPVNGTKYEMKLR